MLIDAFTKELTDAAVRYGFDDWEIYIERAKSFRVKVRNGEVTEYVNAVPQGLCFRGVFGKRVGYAFSERLDETIIAPLLRHAAENAAVLESEEREKLYVGESSDSYYMQEPEIQMDFPTTAKMTEIALAMEQAALSADERVTAVDHCNAGIGDGEVLLYNSHGLNLKHKTHILYAYLHPRVEENGIVKTWGDVWHGAAFGDFDPKALAAETVRKALSCLPAKPIPSEILPVLFDPLTARELFSVFVGAMYAENVQKGFSLLKGKLGENIASPAVTLRDDGICDKSVTYRIFDSEGVACRNKVVVEKGVLKTFLYNVKSAEKDGVKSTGNGFKPNFRAPIDTAVTNFYLEPSDLTPGQLCEGVKRGLLVTGLMGLHSGANAVTGDFSLMARGFMIVNGRITDAVEQVTVAGNFYELLRNITAVGCDLRFGIPTAGGCIGMPSVLVKQLNIAGE